MPGLSLVVKGAEVKVREAIEGIHHSFCLIRQITRHHLIKSNFHIRYRDSGILPNYRMDNKTSALLVVLWGIKFIVPDFWSPLLHVNSKRNVISRLKVEGFRVRFTHHTRILKKALVAVFHQLKKSFEVRRLQLLDQVF
jgi:hypothetical protein